MLLTPARRRRPAARTRSSVLVRVLEVLAIAVASLALSAGLIALLSGFFAGRDQAGISGSSGPPGQTFRDLGHRHLQPGQFRPVYNSDPPTSGAHVPEAVTSDESQLSNDQLLEALQLGDVVIFYGGSAPPPGLRAVARAVGYAFTPDLAAAGQAVILARRPGTDGVLAVAWAHMLSARTPADPRLRQFVSYWLGHGAQLR